MNETFATASLRRRLAALVYDAVALIAVLYFAAFIPVLAAGDALAPGNLPFMLYLLTVSFVYFHLCWARGRTIGMQAWKLEIVCDGGGRPDLRRSALRFAAATLSLLLCGLGYLAALIDTERRTWPDRVSGTRLVRSNPG